MRRQPWRTMQVLERLPHARRPRRRAGRGRRAGRSRCWRAAAAPGARRARPRAAGPSELPSAPPRMIAAVEAALVAQVEHEVAVDAVAARRAQHAAREHHEVDVAAVGDLGDARPAAWSGRSCAANRPARRSRRGRVPLRLAAPRPRSVAAARGSDRSGRASASLHWYHGGGIGRDRCEYSPGASVKPARAGQARASRRADGGRIRAR